MAQSDRGAGGRRAWAWARAALLAIGVLAGAMISRAEARARVVVVSGDYSALGRKLHAEAAAAGFDVIEPASAIDPPSGAELMARHQAAAVIRVVTEDRVDVEFEPAEGATARSFTRRAADGDSFALRVIEELYARLVERGVVTQPEPKDSAPAGARAEAAPLPAAAPSRAAAEDRPLSTESSAGRSTAGFSPRLWLLAGAGATQPAGGISGTLHGAIGARLEPMPRVTTGACALLPLTENNLSGPEGSADVNVNLFLGEIGYVVLEQPRELSLEAGIGAGVLVLASQGEAPAPRSGQDLRTTAGLYFGHSSLAWKVSSWFRLRGSVLGGISAPRPVLRFEGREVASWGRPFVAATLASEFGLSLSAPERSR